MASEKDDGPDPSASRTPDEDAIDAEFQPAPPLPLSGTSGGRRSPGWVALGLTGVTATLLGGVFAILLTSLLADTAPEAGIDTLEASQSELAETLTTELEILADASAALERELSLLAASSVDQETHLILRSELEGVNARLESLLGDGEAGETLTGLSARIVALETADSEGEAISPRLMNRAVTALRERVDTLEARLAALQDLEQEQIVTLGSIVQRLSALEAGELTRENDASAKLRTEIDALKALINDAASSQSAADSQTAAALAASRGAADAAIAFAMIESSASRGQPFQLAYARLTEVMPSDNVIADLAPLAARGAPTVAGLKLSFEAAADQALNAATLHRVNDDGWAWVRRAFGEEISIHRASDTMGGLEAAINDARAALNVSDLTGARASLSPLEGEQVAAFAIWLDGAERRLALDESLQALRLRMMSLE